MILSASLPPALAAEPAEGRPKAMERFRKGEKLHNLSEYAAALEEFRAAYLMVDDPLLLFNIAQCHRLLGNTREAITFYNRYRRAQPEAASRGFVDRKIAELETQLQSVGGVAPDPGKGSTVPPVVSPPLVRSPPVAPVTAPAPRSVATVVVAPGLSVVEPAVASSPAVGGSLRLTGLIGAGVGLAAVGVGVPLYLSAAKKYDECVPNRCAASDLPKGKDTASVLLIWGGATLAMAGVATYLLSPSAPVVVGPVALSSLSIDPRGLAVVTGRY